ncbi:hypothetical protein EUGRSUZ_C03358 [Eucalyptus grandis]|uniref:Uncharacterized protein n=2 Tax=Eucalyptus grandis TaxID=71139 RepID=A0ACC3LK07_EUCGR|nr:hypothetical protein EUGRSUZ_C03358 [Eucalyptus grandis]
MWNSKVLLGTNSCVKYPNQRHGILVNGDELGFVIQTQSGTHALPVRSPTFSRFPATTSSSPLVRTPPFTRP